MTIDIGDGKLCEAPMKELQSGDEGIEKGKWQTKWTKQGKKWVTNAGVDKAENMVEALVQALRKESHDRCACSREDWYT